MHAERRRFLALQVALGPAVLASYALCFARWPEAVARMWGGVPEALRGVYTAWMFVAAAGYAVFTSALFLHADPERARIAFGLRYAAIHALYAALLLGSILWMPLTKWQLDGALPFAAVALDLWLVAAASLGLLATALRLAPPLPGAWRIAAPLGAAAFCVQTVLLDALLWPALWPSAAP
jgi:hypothetical protein